MNLSEISAAEGKKYQGKWTVPANLPYFEGHFPGNPILPAVAIIDFSLCLISKILKQEMLLKGISKAKFTEVVKPNQIMIIEAKLEKSGAWNINWLRENVLVAQLTLEAE